MTENSMRDFAARHVLARGLARAEEFPLDLWRAMAGGGLFRIGLPAEFGGDGGGLAQIAQAEATLVEHGGSLGFALSWTGHQLTALHFLLAHGSEAQKRAYLPGLAAGTLTAAVAISEPGAGAHPKLLKSHAARAGDGWRLSGEKAWVTNGPIADLFIVFAITSVVQERKRYSAFIVARDAPGLTIAPMPLKGLKPSPHCQLKLEAVALAGDAMLGREGEAYEAMALSFRDVEDTVGLYGLVGAFAFLLRRLADPLAGKGEEAGLSWLGELAGLAALLSDGAYSALDALQRGRADAARLVGCRALARTLLARIEEQRVLWAATDDADRDTMLADLAASLAIAERARAIKQARLGARIVAGRLT